ncbi:hypothetical protein FRC05_007811 [Tulasnella sp. 425]|nr:hypothetical protein FRC05_007811 [Tulasnella sp. 425]
MADTRSRYATTTPAMIKSQSGPRPPMFPKSAPVMAQLSEGYWETGRVLDHEIVTAPDGRRRYRYTVAFISSRVFTFDEDELGRPGDIIDRPMLGQGTR